MVNGARRHGRQSGVPVGLDAGPHALVRSVDQGAEDRVLLGAWIHEGDTRT